jgi:hypothetical protein
MDRQTIIEAIESTDYMIPNIPGLLEYVSIPGLKASVTKISDPAANRVSNARLTESNVTGVIAQVHEYYSSRNLAFSWVVGPSTTPATIESHLVKAGMKRTCDVDGMYLADMNLQIPGDSDVTIVQHPASDPGPSIKVMAEAFPMTLESSRHLHQLILLSEPPLRSRIYLGYVEDCEQPVACSYITYLARFPVALLCGAATLSTFRDRGFYTAMLARRLEDARADGIKTLIVLADRTTSAPICKKIGFVKACGLEIYNWPPEPASQ